MRNSDPKLLACLAMLTHRREEKIVASLVQSNPRVPKEERANDIYGTAITVVSLASYLRHRVEPRFVLKNCNFGNYLINLQIIKLTFLLV